MLLTSIKTKLKLTSEQKILMSKHAGISRFTYNWGLATWEALYKEGLKPNHLVLKKFFNNNVKPVLSWIKEKGICQKVTEFAFDNLGKAFKNFFAKRGDYPRFKKKSFNDSFSINAGSKPIPIGGTRIKLPTIGWVSIHEALPHTTTKKITISRKAGEWYISCSYEIEAQPTDKKHPYVGVDLGINVLATLSYGIVFLNPKALKKAKKKLSKLQRQLTLKVKGSNGYKKQKLRISKLHRRVTNIRLDATHKATTFICKNHAVVALEDLNISGMLKNHKLAGAISDANFYEFKRQIEYKTLRYGGTVVLVDRFYPSTKKCSNCGEIKEISLSERLYVCEKCHHTQDRDINAAKNLENYARLAEPCLDVEG
ncbi:RNA-guided endonuclease InsQ/TnpB family protein [Calothrix sp. CCY 0018]|uniref:RNA-guided endonuclease InsQ/TnpB family protein n=1 Tax=Calothrix sp. CCY 0018 TaxID=3103864 RepID=UPI0039C6157E